ncbi:mannose-6-phosphate isomerase, class I [Actinophytocola xinjiangensis]|uniref:mannose-6-phosphate isomerase n=1 Tax=Actinophytocola xinjiangensis TaxID=485602 RepID=A0A7Z1AUW5_9PSEU|nr:mannose-6-phosphate isomerase, class I [Actinophytocola xinjiangensis]OLF04650.1 mannose-6-phosphate isomerase, class I [Actinophytocola xinjiangensis]
MHLLRNRVRPYAWGSRTTIAALLGREVPAPHPEAELWLGAHPGDSSTVLHTDGTERSLVDVLTEDPAGQLGPSVAGRWGERLPFLLKVLAAEEPLSLQAHPSAGQAAEGWAREEQAGIPREAGNRNYPDPTAKPELLCALTEFHALAGFRSPDRTVELLRAIQTPALAPYVDLLAGEPNQEGLRALFTTWITLPQPSIDALLPDLLDTCVQHVKEHGAFELECRTALELAERYPGDSGVLAALLLNRLVLEPGEAIYLPAGNLHTYLHGTAVEVLANSDNVLRGGLTPKHVDVPELLRVLDFGYGDMDVTTGEPVGPRRVYRTSAPEFELSRIEWARDEPRAEVKLEGGLPRIMICVDGAVRAASVSGQTVEFARGESLWLPAADPDVVLTPTDGRHVRVFAATVGTETARVATL